MKLPEESMDVQEQLLEFDQWLTPQLERIKDTDRFKSEISSITQLIEMLAPLLDNFSNPSLFTVKNLCSAVIKSSGLCIQGECYFEDEARVQALYNSLFNLLFLASGATDNNLKNHFLIKLKTDEIEAKYPKRGNGKKTIKFNLVNVPEVLRSASLAKTLAGCYVGGLHCYQDIIKTEPLFSLEIYLTIMLEEYISLILEDEEELFQLWSICHAYHSLKQFSKEHNFGTYLLNSCTIFKVRGSVTASGGHIPEDILRKKLTTLGMQPYVDFNMTDVEIGKLEVLEGTKRKKKTRAYDFVLPFATPDWENKPKLFIQSQFYAGDSGSISHKVVDQTTSSRQFTLQKYPSARFVEYLDGAGYYASLRGDLEHMLTFEDTASFFQVKTSLVRLRRELQQINYLTPVEFEQCLLMSDNNNLAHIFEMLLADGYSENEIKRVAVTLQENGHITINHKEVTICENREAIARKLLILDLAVLNGVKINDSDRKSGKFLLVPGCGANYAILESELSKLVTDSLKYRVISALEFVTDIEWLLDEGVMKRR